MCSVRYYGILSKPCHVIRSLAHITQVHSTGTYTLTKVHAYQPVTYIPQQVVLSIGGSLKVRLSTLKAHTSNACSRSVSSYLSEMTSGLKGSGDCIRSSFMIAKAQYSPACVMNPSPFHMFVTEGVLKQTGVASICCMPYSSFQCYKPCLIGVSDAFRASGVFALKMRT